MSKKNSSVKKYPVEQFFSMRQITGFDISYDDKTIFFITNTTGIPQVWKIPIEGGWADQVTMWSSAVKNVYCFPKSEDILFVSDRDGDEQTQIFRIPAGGGEIINQTDGFEDSQCMPGDFNKKGTKYIFSTNKKVQYNFETYLKNTSDNSNILVKEFDDRYPTLGESISGNERYITFLRFYGNINQDIMLYDAKNGSLKNVTVHDPSEDVANVSTKFAGDNKGFYYLSDSDSDFKGIRYYDIKKDKSDWFIREKWDISGYAISDDEKYLVYTVNMNGSNEPRLYNLKTKKKEKLKLPKGNYTSLKFTGDAKKIVYLMDSPLNPNEIFVYDIKKGKAKQLTNSLTGSINRDAFTKPADVFYESFDGLNIHALLYIPKGLKKDGTNPAIVWPHGGPEHQETHNFNRNIQVLANAGYIIIAPNFRGSTGYGKKFQKMIYNDWGGNEFKDVLGAVDYLRKTGYVDDEKIAVVGGSFGGFMTLTCITRAPEIWKCAIDIFGPSNLHTFLKSIPEHWKEGAYKLVGNPDKDKELLDERSPINYVDNIVSPLLVIQGRHDPRVVEEESVQIVNKLKENNKEVDYLLLEDEGHGFSKVSNVIKVFNKNLEFLEKHLRN